MAIADLADWLDDYAAPDIVWYVKRLSGNDTLANGSHQAGPYIAREFLFRVFPTINRTDIKNPDVWFDLYIDSNADHRKVRAVYYNNAYFDGTRNEARLTNFGGQGSALLDPDSTGALAVFAFRLDSAGAASDCHAWVCQHETEEDLVEDRVGPVDPGKFLVWPPGLISGNERIARRQGRIAAFRRQDRHGDEKQGQQGDAPEGHRGSNSRTKVWGTIWP